MIKILGFNKLTLLDYPNKMACIIFLAGCNFLCPFCHNRDLVVNPDLSTAIDEKEVFDYLIKRKNILEGVCITGGEPLLQKDLISFLQKIRDIGYKIKIDTNGSLPDKLKEIIDKDLVDYIAMDIKNSIKNYSLAVGINNFDTLPILNSMEIIKNSGLEYEFRTTLVEGIHKEEDLHLLGQLLREENNYYLQAFKDSDSIINKKMNLSPINMKNSLSIIKKYVKNVKIRE